MHVLVIEDSPSDALLIEQGLGEGFEVCLSTSLATGLAAASQTSFDLLILDLSLVDSSGYSTFEKARTAIPEVPILILSGHDDEELALKAVSNGAQDYVSKNALLNTRLDRAARYSVERHGVERRRLAALRSYEILDTDAERSFDDLALLASHICNTPIALISLIDADRQWFKAKVGIDADASPRSISFCTHAIKGRKLFTVPDATQDQRFAANPFVTGAPNIRFYAGAPLITKSGDALGTICVVDHTPRTLHSNQVAALEALSRQIVDQLELRRAIAANTKLNKKVKQAAKRRIRQIKFSERLSREQSALRDAVSGMEQVLGVVGHELRTPLAALRAISEFLLTDGAKETAEADRFLTDISEEVDRMSDTVNNLLEAARLNSGRARWNWSEFDLTAVVQDAVESIQPLMNSQPVQLTSELAGGELRVAGDAEALRRLIVNLLSNARKYTSEGQINVSASESADSSGRWIELKVSDTGSGIPPEVAARLGEAFALNSGVVGHNHVSGTGLGLAICKGIAAAHEGDIRFRSVVGQGTTVIVRIRADLDEANGGDTVREAVEQECLV